jgi:hypothetical protein
MSVTTMGDPSISAVRRAVEERWCARVRAAKLRFELAVAQAAQASREPNTSATQMYHEVEHEAREAYLRELQIFTDMVVRGKMPGDETTQ